MPRKIKSMPDTSLEANKRATHEMRSAHYQKILEALGKLRIANYEKIAETAGFGDRNMASRRLKEMVLLGMVVKTDIKTATTSGRSGYCYSLPNKGVISPTEIVDTIIHNATKPDYTQPELF